MFKGRLIIWKEYKNNQAPHPGLGLEEGCEILNSDSHRRRSVNMANIIKAI